MTSTDFSRKIKSINMIICEQYFKDGKLSVKEICERVEISRATYYKGLRYRVHKVKLWLYQTRE
ncbi:helix-turn-helix domain-containing protein [Arenibacter algicola]|uniref:helix-turn-helix domain-containing protein n=1 Tax=Arenibacter algicola TaxID=616991 RepID=UPI00339D40DF